MRSFEKAFIFEHHMIYAFDSVPALQEVDPAVMAQKQAAAAAEARKKAEEGAAAMAQKQAAAAAEARKKAEEEAAAERKREQARMEERRLCVSGCPLLLFWCRLLVCLYVSSAFERCEVSMRGDGQSTRLLI